MLYNALIIVEVVVALALVLLILLQQGKGADAGAAFGSGASGTVFGSRGTASFLGKATAALAFIFMANSTAMAYLSHAQVSAPQSAVERAAAAGNASEPPQNAPGTPTGNPADRQGAQQSQSSGSKTSSNKQQPPADESSSGDEQGE